MPERMSDKKNGALPVPNQTSEPVVSFYLTQETDLAATFRGEHQAVTIRVAGSSEEPTEKPALRVTFPHTQSIKQLAGLVAFGSDPKCHVVLPVGVASKVHCKVWAQLNSGPRMWLVEDVSENGTEVEDDETSQNNVIKIIQRRFQAAQGLRAIKIGHYRFEFRTPVSNIEVQRQRDWFRLNKSIPVTKSMLDRQLDGLEYDWLRMDIVGRGGFGNVYRCIERHTALCVAIKEEQLNRPGRELSIKKEIKFMKALRHPHLVDIICSMLDRDRTVPTQLTVMPLYLGSLWDLLLTNPDIEVKERIMLQIMEGVNFMHQNQVLHRDLKPDNIFWVTESPMTVKIGDYGLATMLTDHNTLLEGCGTAAYMAPENFQGKIPRTKASDIFSLGPTVYAILEPELVNQNWYKKGRYKLNRVYENVGSAPPKLYGGLVQSMMAPNPEDRPTLQSCMEIIRGKNFNWTKGAPLAIAQAAAPIGITPQGRQPPTDAPSQGQQSLERARAYGRKRILPPIFMGVQPSKKLQQAPAIRENIFERFATPIPVEPATAERVYIQIRPPASPNPVEQAPIQRVSVQDHPPVSPNPVEQATVHRVSVQDRPPAYDEVVGVRRLAPRNVANPIREVVDQPRHEPRHTRIPNENRVRFNDVPAIIPAPVIRAQRAVAPAAIAPNLQRPASSSTSSAARARHQEPHNARQPHRRPREQAINIHRAQNAGIQRRQTRTAKERRLADIKEGLYDIAQGTFFVTRGILGLAGHGLLAGGERILQIFQDEDSARDALEHVAANLDPEA